jgi:hypothetical protein
MWRFGDHSALRIYIFRHVYFSRKIVVDHVMTMMIMVMMMMMVVMMTVATQFSSCRLEDVEEGIKIPIK